jgi:hypothetical protein
MTNKHQSRFTEEEAEAFMKNLNDSIDALDYPVALCFASDGDCIAVYNERFLETTYEERTHIFAGASSAIIGMVNNWDR